MSSSKRRPSGPKRNATNANANAMARRHKLTDRVIALQNVLEEELRARNRAHAELLARTAALAEAKCRIAEAQRTFEQQTASVEQLKVACAREETEAKQLLKQKGLDIRRRGLARVEESRQRLLNLRTETQTALQSLVARKRQLLRKREVIKVAHNERLNAYRADMEQQRAQVLADCRQRAGHELATLEREFGKQRTAVLETMTRQVEHARAQDTRLASKVSQQNSQTVRAVQQQLERALAPLLTVVEDTRKELATKQRAASESQVMVQSLLRKRDALKQEIATARHTAAQLHQESAKCVAVRAHLNQSRARLSQWRTYQNRLAQSERATRTRIQQQERDCALVRRCCEWALRWARQRRMQMTEELTRALHELRNPDAPSQLQSPTRRQSHSQPQTQAEDQTDAQHSQSATTAPASANESIQQQLWDEFGALQQHIRTYVAASSSRSAEPNAASIPDLNELPVATPMDEHDDELPRETSLDDLSDELPSTLLSRESGNEETNGSPTDEVPMMVSRVLESKLETVNNDSRKLGSDKLDSHEFDSDKLGSHKFGSDKIDNDKYDSEKFDGSVQFSGSIGATAVFPEEEVSTIEPPSAWLRRIAHARTNDRAF